MRERLIKAGVANLKRFGYPTCNAKNITTDRVYRQFFLSMLIDSKGKDPSADEHIDKLIAECERAGSDAGGAP